MDRAREWSYVGFYNQYYSGIVYFLQNDIRDLAIISEDIDIDIGMNIYYQCTIVYW